MKGTLLKMRRAATDITELYAPQFEQFGLQLSGKGAVFTGEVANDRAFHYPDAQHAASRIHARTVRVRERGQRAHAHVHARSRHNACEP